MKVIQQATAYICLLIFRSRFSVYVVDILNFRRVDAVLLSDALIVFTIDRMIDKIILCFSCCVLVAMLSIICPDYCTEIYC